jgi:predicted ester cyclase
VRHLLPVEEQQAPDVVEVGRRRVGKAPGLAEDRSDQIFGEGDYVTTRWTATGTQRGELMGIKPTNRRTVTHGCSVGQLKNGKGVHDWIYWDTGHLLRQLGVLPAA